MRLYDQSSSTPMKWDVKKWMRPNNFLPSQKENANADPPHEKRSASIDMIENVNCGSETSASTAIEISKVYKHHTIHDDFRFDIDEEQELSMKSSSTLSTHSTFQHATHDLYAGYRNEFLKSISVCRNVAFESSSRYSKTSSITTAVRESVATESGKNSARYLSRDDEDENILNDDFLTPKLTLTQSSEEGDSVWIEFQGFGSKNPFRIPSDTYQSNILKQPRILSSIENQSLVMKNRQRQDIKMPQTSSFVTNQRKVSNRYIMNEGTGNYTKYYEMLLDGVSVDELLKTMEKDEVDPSIISLVLAASKSN